jgi:hypothetical protein
LGGIEHLAELFDLESADPAEVDALIAAELGSDMPTAMIENRVAIWVQASSGPYGFNGLLQLEPSSAPTVPAGTSSLQLLPFGGTYFVMAEAEISYPGTQGENIAYVGIDDAGSVDGDEPFTVDGGVLVVNNRGMVTTYWTEWTPEHSGPDLPAIGGLP